MSAEAAKIWFTGLDEVRPILDEHQDAMAYAVLLHVVDREKRIPVVRINLTKSELEPFLDTQASVGEPSRTALCDALMRRVPVEVEGHLSEPEEQTYMLRLHRPKGGYLGGKSFHAERIVPPVPTALAPIVVQLNPDMLPEARVWRALGGAVEDFLGTVIRAVSGLLDAERRVVEQQADELARSWKLVEALTAQLLAERADRARVEADQRADDGAQRVRDVLVGKLLEELVTLGQAQNAARGAVAPELVELFDRFAASPALVEALADPGVRAMLLDPKACEALARHLLEAARG